MKKRYKFLLLGSLLALVVGVLGTFSVCTVVGCRNLFWGTVISDFEQCVEAGFPVVEADPPRCVVSEDEVFIRQPQNIQVSSPLPKVVLTSPFVLEGRALALNNTLYYRLKDGDKILGEGTLQTNSSEHGRWGTFAGEVSFDAGDAQEGLLELYDQSPEGERASTLEVPVYFVEPEHSEEESVSLGGRIDPLATAPMEVPNKVVLNVPFTPQAPYADWNPPFNEACEEASLLMVEYYLKGDRLSAEQANADIIALVDDQTAAGYLVDVNTDELLEIAQSLLGRSGKVYTDTEVTAQNIRRLVATGHPVIIPAAGQMLGNPYFLGAGPPYHMLVITGYEGDQFITNDPGTKRGEGYRYDADVIMEAIHDWTGDTETITSGRKAMLVIQ